MVQEQRSKLGLATVSRQSAAEQVYRALREKIEDGSLAPGEPLADSALAQELGVSRTPVREALRRLVDQGVVETTPGRSTRVADVDQAQARQVFPLLSWLHRFAAEAASGGISDADIAEMRECNDQMRSAVSHGDLAAARDADRRFHGVLIRRAANPYLTMLIDTMSLHSHRLEALYFRDRGPAEESYHQHEHIIDALAQGDQDKTRELVGLNTERGPER